MTTNVKPGLSVAAALPGFVTTISNVPAGCAGVVAVIVFASTTLIFAAATPPKVTAAPVWKSVPVIVTLVPPALEPVAGATPVGFAGVATTVIVPCIAGTKE